MVGGIISLMIFYLLDAYFIAQLGIDELAVLGFTIPFSMTLVNLAVGLGIGISATVARVQGAGNNHLVSCIGRDALLLAAIVLLTIIFVSRLLIDDIFSLMGAPERLQPLINNYLEIWLIGCAFQLILMNCNAIFRATGNTRTPAKLMAFGAALNALLDPLFIFGAGPIEGMGLVGAALAAIVSWFCALVLGCYLLILKYRLVTLSIPHLHEIAKSWPGITRIALPAALSNMMTPLAIALITTVVAGFGPQAVAAFGVGERISALALLVILSLSMTLPPLISQNLGADQFDRISQAINGSHRFSLQWQTVIYLLLASTAPWSATFFSDDPIIHNYLSIYMWTVVLSLGPLGVTILTVSSLNALHYPAKAMALSSIRLFLLYVPLAWAGSMLAGLTGLFIGATLANILSAIVARKLLALDELTETIEK